MKRWLLLAALLLPIIGLGSGIWRNQASLGQAELWRIPITGYDPRDPLRGRFITFAYDWQVKGFPEDCNRPEGCQLCLEQEGETVRAVITASGVECASPVDLNLSQIDMRQPFREDDTLTFTSRIFVSEASAPTLEEQLREGPMIVVAARTPEGRLVNRRIEPAG
jgi:hypothetical protein